MALPVGSTACIRDLYGEQIMFAWPVVVERTTDSHHSGPILVSQLTGSVGLVPEGYPDDLARMVEQFAARRWHLVERPWSTTNCLHIIVPGAWWSTRLMWSSDDHEFLCWYVDFRLPVSVKGVFLETRDLQLDVVVSADGSWRWKDEDHYALAVDGGVIDDRQHAAVERARADVVEAIEAGRFPFDGSHLDWTPRGDVPSLPEGSASRT